MKKHLRTLLSIVIAAALLISCVPTVFAEDAVSSPIVSARTPTPELIYAVLNGAVVTPDGGIGYGPELHTLSYPDGTPIKLSELIVNEEGDLGDRAVTALMFEATKIFAGDDVSMTDEDAEEMLSSLKEAFGDPLNLYTIIDVGIDKVYELVCGISEEIATNYPTAESFRLAVMQKLFDGNPRPTPEQLIALTKGIAVQNPDTSISITVVRDIIVTEEFGDEIVNMVLTLDKGVTERGRINVNLDGKDYGSVYEKLVAERDSITATQALAIMTGYLTDPFGNLYTAAPIYNYFNTEKSGVLRADNVSASSLIDNDGTIAGTGLTYGECLKDSLLADYETIFRSLPAGIRNLAGRAISSDLIEEMIDAQCAEASIPTFEEFCEMYAVEGDDEAYLREQYEDFLGYMLLQLFEIDPYGRVATDYTYGYLLYGGSEVNVSQVMDPETGVLADSGAFGGAETIFEALDAYIASLTHLGVSLAGDVNDDGELSLDDVITMLKHIAGWDINLDDQAQLAADVDGDGEITVSDCIASLKKIADWDINLVG